MTDGLYLELLKKHHIPEFDKLPTATENLYHEDIVALAGEVRPEVCLCAALLVADGRIIRGHRHDDCILTAYGKLHIVRNPTVDQQGFLTSYGRFVDRREAAVLQRVAGIKSVNPNSVEFPTYLFSEDLY